MMGVAFSTNVLIPVNFTTIIVKFTATIRVPLQSVFRAVVKVVKVIRVIRVLILGIYRKTVTHMCF